MASPSAQLKQDGRFTVSSLLSPPELKRLDSFTNSPMPRKPSHSPHSSHDSGVSMPTMVHSLGSNLRQSRAGLPPSPPVSPYDNVHKEQIQTSADEDTTRDPPLYPSGAPSEASEPLFPSSASEHDSLIARHVSSTKTAGPRPTADEYRLVVACKATVFQRYNKDPKGYMRKEKATWNLYGPKRNTATTKSRNTLRTLAPAPAGVRKPKTTVARAPRASRPIKRTPKAAVLDSFTVDDFKPSVPAAPKTPRAPAPRDDVDFRSLPDYSPPVSLLPEDGKKGLKADWKGQPLDLSTDPDRHELHPAELNVASTLRLSCGVYLANKRRIFAARVRALLRNEDFNKTKAQQACKIDVNKASKLWAAYERIGWFDPRLFQHHLGNFVDIE
ncbi:hypothetical protein K490DRAFT_74925 [Saccharata proteae CBS 121410]|uniref:SWIRM domain-containing protein n=1 Tax=Saccharata proteae CBS 121410 TaxID=1314787 RepID=A0A9P4HSS4_9PEZI|nr:hypothetical protein K490DRAFT_74925 [Saccharata proteae CBS 121410]